MRNRLAEIIVQATSALCIKGKCGKSDLQPTIASALRAEGYIADTEDTQAFLPAQLPVWRSKDTGEVEPTRRRHLVDIVVYKSDRLVALIETESDLNDLCRTGVKKRNGHYDVSSIARSKAGDFFHSYKSLERMAAAAFYTSLQGEPTASDRVIALSAVRSDLPADHNPLGISMFLVSGSCRSTDHEILEDRLKSLNAQLICIRQSVGR